MTAASQLRRAAPAGAGRLVRRGSQRRRCRSRSASDRAKDQTEQTNSQESKQTALFGYAARGVRISISLVKRLQNSADTIAGRRIPLDLADYAQDTSAHPHPSVPFPRPAREPQDKVTILSTANSKAHDYCSDRHARSRPATKRQS